MILLVANVIFLFVVYTLSKDDFVFLRRNISVSTVFDSIIGACLVGFFFSRLIYVASHPSFDYINPLVFLVIPYFPGLSFAGFLLGSCVCMYFLGMRQKLPLGRLYDIFSLALLPSATIFLLGNGINVLLHKNSMLGASFIGVGFFLFLCFMLLQQLFQKSMWEDGSLAFIAFSVISFFSLFLEFLQGQFKLLPQELPYFTLMFLLLFVSFLITRFRKAGQNV